MISEENKHVWIEQYLANELTGPELAAFEQKLVTDNAFRTEVALEQAIVRNLKVIGRQEMHTRLEAFHQALLPVVDESPQAIPNRQKTSAGRSFFPRKWHYWLAAASVVLVAISTWLVLQHRANSTETIFTAYYQPYPSLEYNQRGAGNVPVTLKEEAFTAYANGKYQQSIQPFEQWLSSYEDEVCLFYLGNAYLSAGKPTAAIQTFRKYLQRYHEFEVEAQWYLSLSYLKAGNRSEAHSLLKPLANTPNDYQQRARALLRDWP